MSGNQSHVQHRQDYPPEDRHGPHRPFPLHHVPQIAAGTFPSQVKISVHGVGWRESAVNRWIDDPVSYRNESVGQ